MGKIRCRQCGAVFSSRRGECPGCGKQRKKAGQHLSDADRRAWRMLIFGAIMTAIIIAAIILAVVLFGNGDDPDSSNDLPINNVQNNQSDDNQQDDDPNTDDPNTDDPNTDDPNTDDPNTDDPNTDDPPEVDPPPAATVNSITLSIYDFTLAFNGDSWTIRATVDPEEMADQVVWESADTSVVTVDETGLVTAVGPGRTTVTATCGGKSAECVVYSNAEVSTQPGTSDSGIRISSSDITISVEETAYLSVYSAEDALLSVTWTSADESIATVNNFGKVTGVGSGTTTVTGTYSGSTVSCIVRVR